MRRERFTRSGAIHQRDVSRRDAEQINSQPAHEDRTKLQRALGASRDAADSQWLVRRHYTHGPRFCPPRISLRPSARRRHNSGPKREPLEGPAAKRYFCRVRTGGHCQEGNQEWVARMQADLLQLGDIGHWNYQPYAVPNFRTKSVLVVLSERSQKRQQQKH